MTAGGVATATSPRRTRRWALVRGVAVLPYVAWSLTLDLLAAVLWPPALLGALIIGRAPAWWRRLAWLTVRTAARTRAFSWLLTEARPGTAGSRASVVLQPPPVARLPRRSLLARLLLAPWWLALRWVMGWLGRVLALAAWVSRVVVGRDPRALRALRFTQQAYCSDADAYLLLLAPGRPRLPEPDPRLRAGAQVGAEYPPLPRWRRRVGFAALGVEAGAFMLAGSALVAKDAVAVEFFADCLVQGFIPLTGIYIVAQTGPLQLEQFGLHVLHPWRSLGWAVAMIATALLIAGSLALLIGPFLAAQDSSGDALVPDGAGLGWTIGFVALATVIAPLFEEFFYRGIVFQAFRGTGTWAAAVGSSFAFALAHFDFNPIAVADRTAIGIGLCWLFARTGRLLPGMFAHSINNAVVVPLEIGWTVEIALVLPVSLLCIALAVKRLSRHTGTWAPVET